MAETSTRLLTVLRCTATALHDRNRPFALVGGLAVSVRVEPRFTRDIDLAVAVADDVDAEALTRELQTAGFGLRLSLEQQALARLATVRLVPPGESAEGIAVDLLFASTGIEPDICAAAEPVAMEDFVVPVAAVGHLLAMKLLARADHRPQDAVDLEALLRVLTPAERARAITAVGQIERLGANRGKPLRLQLDALLNR